ACRASDLAGKVPGMRSTCVAPLLFLIALTGHASPKPRNVILIMADDSHADNYGCYGSTFFKTPRLDALAREGAKFNHCYSEPVCTSSRVKIMTGRDGIRNYVKFGTLDRDETTFGTMMKNAGYATAIAGKWQLHGGETGSLAPDCGFDSYCLWNYPGTERSRYWNPSFMRDGKLLETTDGDYGPDIMTDFLIEFIEKNRDRPFFGYYPMLLVHSPFPKTPDSATDDGKSIENFRDMTLYADKCVGRIVDALEKHGLREDTVIIYTTDNGTGRSLSYPFKEEQRQGEKAFATDGGTHAPLIVNCPGTVPPGTVTDDLVDFSDFLPTLAAITGANLPAVQLDGRSFWPQCQGQAGNPRDWIFQYYFPKFIGAAKAHGLGVGGNEIVWAQNQKFKLYRDGSLYAVSDRHEKSELKPGASRESDSARQLLQGALDSMPKRAAKLEAGVKRRKKQALLDGNTLDQWTSIGSAKWRVEDGILVGSQDGDPKRSGLILSKRAFKDFDLELEFKIDEHGKYNSGVYLRHDPKARGSRGYQINIGRGAAKEYTGLFLKDWLDKGDEHDKIRRPLQWNQLRIRAIGAHIESWLNGHKIVDYTDPDPEPELVKSGVIAFQTYGAEGHAGWVHFRNIEISELE
ncbi:MAG: sulfatase-like hydrolase/transferase, partial [Verrucomicrobiales bacterium]